MDRLDQQMGFILEVEKLKNVFRQSYIADGTRKENDAEHTWSLAMMCAILGEYSREPINIGKTITMVLIHDMVEIDAGDTYAYDENGNATKREREVKAADRIFGLLPKDQEVWLRSLWEEFEEGETAEARFALTMDKIQPILLNDANNGKSWRQHQVKQSQIMKRNENTHKGSEELWAYARALIEKNVESGNIKKDM